jgi:hypothetical protein
MAPAQCLVRQTAQFPRLLQREDARGRCQSAVVDYTKLKKYFHHHSVLQNPLKYLDFYCFNIRLAGSYLQVIHQSVT